MGMLLNPANNGDPLRDLACLVGCKQNPDLTGVPPFLVLDSRLEASCSTCGGTLACFLLGVSRLGAVFSFFEARLSKHFLDYLYYRTLCLTVGLRPQTR